VFNNILACSYASAHAHNPPEKIDVVKLLFRKLYFS